MGQGHAKEGGDPGILKDPKEQGLWGSLGGGQNWLRAPYSRVWQSCGPSPQQRPSAHNARQSGPVPGRGGAVSGQMPWGNGNPQTPSLGKNPSAPLGCQCSQLRLRVLSTRVSPRSSLCRWKMSDHRMVSWKQSWGFFSMRTPPFRISVQGQHWGAGGISAWGWRGGVLQPHGDSQPWARTWSPTGTPNPAWGTCHPMGTTQPQAGQGLYWGLAAPGRTSSPRAPTPGKTRQLPAPAAATRSPERPREGNPDL